MLENISHAVSLILTSVDNIQNAEKIAEVLVKERLAACVQVVPKILSFYSWEGKLQKNEEFLLILKTRADRLDALEKKLTEIHPYQCPEIVMLQADHVSAAYRQWLISELDPKKV